jgi:serine phosphatase RsbU (regulator of sigma subunit)
VVDDLQRLVAGLTVPLGATAGADHVVTCLNRPAGDLLAGLVVGLPVPHDAHALRDALDLAARRGEPTTAALPGGHGSVECVPLAHGVLLHVVADGPRRGPGNGATGAALQHLVGELLREVTPAAIGRSVATTAAGLLGADAAVVYSRAGDDLLTALHSTGWPADLTKRYEHLRLHRGRPLSDAVLDGTPVWLEDAAQWRRRYPDMAPIGTAGGVQATACLPLRVEERDLGAVVFSFLTPREFTPAEREFLLAVTALCAQALDRARLLTAERAARARAEGERDRMTFLARATRLMEAPLEVEQRLQRFADLVAADVADWCAVHLVRGDHVERVAVAHSDPGKVAFVAELQRRYPPGPDAAGGAIEVSRTGTPVFLPEIPDDLLVAAAADDEHLALLRSIGMRSAVVVPLLVRGRSLGAVTLVQAESGRHFDELDLAFARQLAAGAAVALDNARLYEHQRRTADTLQSALLPALLPAAPGLRLAARYRPQNADGSDLHVGGDLYDVMPGPEPGQWAFAVADVCGKGAQAAALTALIRHTVRAEVGHGLEPVEVLQRLNRAMLRGAADGAARFATVVHGRLDLTDGGATLRLASAGHPPPLVLSRGRVRPVTAPGTLLGVYPEVDLTGTTTDLSPGDMLVLYTDGVTEGRRMHEYYGSDRLVDALTATPHPTADAVAAALLDDVVAFQDGRLRDDVAILVLEVAP